MQIGDIVRYRGCGPWCENTKNHYKQNDEFVGKRFVITAEVAGWNEWDSVSDAVLTRPFKTSQRKTRVEVELWVPPSNPGVLDDADTFGHEDQTSFYVQVCHLEEC